LAQLHACWNAPRAICIARRWQQAQGDLCSNQSGFNLAVVWILQASAFFD